MKKALIVATTASMIDQFNMSNIYILKELGFQVSVACNFHKGNTVSEEHLEKFKCKLMQLKVLIHYIDFPRSPYNCKQLYLSYKELKRLVFSERYDLIHCHTPVGGLVSRMVGIEAKRKNKINIIYTAHGFHFYKGAPMKNWLLYFPIEWLLAHWTDVLITINKEDYARARRFMKAKYVEYIPGVGIDLKKYALNPIDKNERSILRHSLGVGDNDKMLISVGELNRNKNHEIVIRTIAQLGDTSLHYVIAGRGELYEYLINLANTLGVGNRVHLLGFSDDVINLCRCADLYIHPSYREGLSVALMEAMALKIPIICSKVRGNIDLINEEDFLFAPDDVNEIIRSLQRVLQMDTSNVVERHYQIIKRYGKDIVLHMLRKQYERVYQ